MLDDSQIKKEELKEALMNQALGFLADEKFKKSLGIDIDAESIKKSINEETDKEKKKKLLEKLNEFIPKFEEFTIEGRIYDKITSKPLEGVEVIPVLGIGDSSFTDKKGEFISKLEIPIIPYNNKSLINSKLLYKLDGYIPSLSEVVTQQRNVKTNIQATPLINLEKAAKLAADEAEQKVYDAIDYAINVILTPVEKIRNIRTGLIMKQTKLVFGRLLPLGFRLMGIFGISSIKDKNKSICPSQEQLASAVKKRNEIARTLNKIYTLIAVNVGLAVLFTYIAMKLRMAKNQIASLSFPVATPPGVGVPYSLISALEEVKKLITDFRKQVKNDNIFLVISLIFLVVALKILGQILSTVDSLIFKCAPKNIPLVELNQDLKDLFLSETKEEDTRQFINGFEIEVIELDKNSIDGVKRKQAIGKNNRGIIIVRGEPSFSASDQVLINELKFTIQVNNIKPF